MLVVDFTFLEVKLKNNKGKTIKKRVKVPKISSQLSVEQKAFIEKNNMREFGSER